jgi:eukaryotic-like serine/threonine-protein kinase
MLINQSWQWQNKLLDNRYRLVQLLGRGGMGEVWQAEDIRLQRQVAVKTLAPVLKGEQDYLRCFSGEAQVAASLDHPHILPVHDFGGVLLGDEVITYLVMPLISGGTLQDRIRNQQGLIPIEESLKYLRQAAEAIDHAYQNRIIHRDIKPSNMLLQEGWLFLSDFGLARLFSTNTYRSRTHTVAGTPQYMAPEQIRGRAVAASDRYSLAVIAYQLLSGYLPFQDEQPFAIFLKHLYKEPPSPRQFNPQLPEAMERAILKSLAKNPAVRHLSSVTLVEELEQGWQKSSSLSLIGHDPEATQIRGQRRADPVDIPTLVKTPDATVPVTSLLSDPLTQKASPDQQHVLAEQKPAKSSTMQKQDRRLPRRALLLGGGAATLVLLAGGGLAMATMLSHPKKLTGPQQLIAGKPVLKLAYHIDTVWNICWNPNGRYLVTTSGRNVGSTALGDNRVALWDIERLIGAKQSTTDQVSQIWQMKDVTRAHCVDWSPDGRTLGLVTDNEEMIASQHGMYSLMIIDPFAQNTEPRKLFDAREGNDFIRYSALSWSPTGNMLATLTHPEARGRPQGITLWQADKQESVKFFANPQPETMMDLLPENLPAQPDILRKLNYKRKRHCLCWTSDGTKILVQDNLLNIRIWDVHTSTSQQSISLPDRSNAISMGKRPDVPVQMYLPTVRPSPTDPALFATNDLDIIVIADANRHSVQRQLICNDVQALSSGIAIEDDRYYPQVSALAWSPNGRSIAGAYMSSPQIFIWDLQDPHPHRDKDGLQLPALSFGKTDGQDFVLTDLAWSPDGRYLASSSFDTTVIIWQVDKR